MDPVYVGDEVIDTMSSGVKAMAIMYSGDATTVMSENPNMEYYLPEEGTNVWFDGFVISKECKNTKLANEFINHMISNSNSYKNTIEVGYLTANVKAAKKLLKMILKELVRMIFVLIQKMKYLHIKQMK